MDTKKILEIVQADRFVQLMIVFISALFVSILVAFILPLSLYNELLKYLYDNRLAFVAYLCIPNAALFWILLKQFILKLNNGEATKIVKVVDSKSVEAAEKLEHDNEALRKALDNLQTNHEVLRQKYVQIESEYEQKIYDLKSDFETELLVKEHEFQEFLAEKLKDRNLEESRLFLARCIELCESFASVHVLVEKCLLQLMIKLGYDGYEYSSEKDFREALTLARQTNDFSELLADLSKKFKGKKFPSFDKIVAKLIQSCAVKFKDEKLIEAMQYFEVPTKSAKLKFNESTLGQYLDGIDDFLNLFDALKDDFNYVVREVVKSDAPKFNIPKIEEVVEEGEYDAPLEIAQEDDDAIMESLAETTSEDEKASTALVDAVDNIYSIEQNKKRQNDVDSVNSHEDMTAEEQLDSSTSDEDDDEDEEDLKSLEKEHETTDLTADTHYIESNEETSSEVQSDEEELSVENEQAAQQPIDSTETDEAIVSITDSHEASIEESTGSFKIPRRRPNKIKQELFGFSREMLDNTTSLESNSVVEKTKESSQEEVSVTKSTAEEEPKFKKRFLNRKASFKPAAQEQIKDSSLLVDFEKDADDQEDFVVPTVEEAPKIAENKPSPTSSSNEPTKKVFKKIRFKKSTSTTDDSTTDDD